MRFFNRLSIQSKLMTMLLAVSIGSIAVIAYEGYRSGRSAIEESVVNQLAGFRAAKTSQIEEYFLSLRSEAKVLGASTGTAAAMKDFTAAYGSVLGDAKFVDGARSNSLRQFYRQEFGPKLAANLGQGVDPDVFLPVSILGRYLQAEYIVKNPQPVGEKLKLEDAGDGTQYSALHKQYHPVFREILEEFGYYDLFLIDNDGNIVYSVAKETDFGTNLRTGPYAQSDLAAVYKDAQKQNSGYVTMSDFSAYEPSYGVPAAFMAKPIYQGTSLMGVMAIQIPVDEIDTVMTGDRKWVEDGLQKTGETFIVGKDEKMRSDSRGLIERPEAYFQALKNRQVSPDTVALIERLGTSALNQPADSEAVSRAANGETGIASITNYLGEQVISAYGPLDIRDVEWVIISEIDKAEIYQPITNFARRVLIAAAGLVFVITLASLWLARAFLKPVNLLSDGFRRLAKGHQDVVVEVLAEDELGELGKSFNHMVKKNRKTSELVHQKNQETEALLLNMFPPSVAKRLKKGSALIADDAENVTVVFANVLNFQALTESLKPKKAIAILNEIVKALDEATEHHGIEKIKTTGSEYLAVSGLSEARLDHAKRVIDFAIEAIRIVNQVSREQSVDLQMRVGIHSGGIMAGTVGSQRLIYDVWGNTVAIAHSVQSAASPESIYVTETVANSLVDIYEFEPIGEITARKGEKVSVFCVKI
ncbi:MAG: adenylate/guanylate cyclase domain-containing protein [Phormidesmis sp.]